MSNVATIDNVLAHMRTAEANEGLQAITTGSPQLQLRKRVTVAQVNAGLTLVPAPGPGYALRFMDALVIAVGGAATVATTVDILGTIAAASAKLVAIAIAALTQSTLNRPGQTNNVVLADGGSFIRLDANTAITIGKTGGTLAGLTNVDILVEYAVEKV